MKKFTTEEVKNKLIEKSIDLVGSYVSCLEKTIFKCSKNHTWAARPSDIFQGGGCPFCNLDNRRKPVLTKIEVEYRLKSRSIELIGSFKGVGKKTEFRCLKDDHIWFARPADIFNGGGCPRCSKHLPLTNEIFDKRLKEKDIQISRLEDISTTRMKIKFKCDICNHIWTERTNNILFYDALDSRYKYFGCQKCRELNHRKKHEKIIDDVINGLILRLSPYQSSVSSMSFHCLSCDHKWSSNYCNIVNSGAGCPSCRFKNQQLVGKLINEIFGSNNVIANYRLTESKGYSKRGLVIDFFLLINNEIIFIEYNGQQHYKPVKFGGRSDERAQKAFLKQQERDDWLRKFCIENNISLLELPYTLSIDDISNQMKDLSNQVAQKKLAG